MAPFVPFVRPLHLAARVVGTMLLRDELMQVEIVRIGNSRGVRIPKSIIEQCGFGDHINLRVEEGCVILARYRKPREGSLPPGRKWQRMSCCWTPSPRTKSTVMGGLGKAAEA